MSLRGRTILPLAAAILVIAAAVWTAGETARSAAAAAVIKRQSAEAMLRAVLDQQIGLEGFLRSRDEEHLDHFRKKAQEFEVALATASARLEPHEAGRFRRQVAAARAWQAHAQQELAESPHGRRRHADDHEAGDALLDRFRELILAHERLETEEAQEALARSGKISVGLIIALGLGFGGIGLVSIERRARRAARAATAERRRQERDSEYRAHQEEFRVALQAARSESEAHGLLRRHLERSVADARVTVLNRNNSDNRLEAVKPVAEGTALAKSIGDAEPESCLAVRLAARHDRAPEREPLMHCDVCGKIPGATSCTPSLVGGEVIGSVLIERPAGPLDAVDARRFDDSVAQAAPVLGNLRNLRLAETRAATDALTGLANRRAADETLRRMLAEAARRTSPLAIALFDVDHFKRVNDIYGHDKGDQVLAAIGDAVATGVRASDFVARYGGEEFLVALPDTDAPTGADVCDKLRKLVSDVRVAGVNNRITASFGVAAYPADGVDLELLLRTADRALYTAKSSGRDQVCLLPAREQAATPS